MYLEDVLALKDVIQGMANNHSTKHVFVEVTRVHLAIIVQNIQILVQRMDYFQGLQ